MYISAMELTAIHRAALLEQLDVAQKELRHCETLHITLANAHGDDADIMRRHEIDHYLILSRITVIRESLTANQIDY